MKQERTLDSYAPYPINDIIQKRLKLTALILSRPDLYFLPEAILAGSDIRTSVENERLALRNRQPSIDGNYELTGISSIVNELESLSGRSPLNRSLAVAGLKSPDGVAGCLIIIEKWERLGHMRTRPQLASIPLNRILVKAIHSMDQMNECQIGTPEHQVMVAVHNEFWADGKGAPQGHIRKWIRANFKDLKLGNNWKLGNSNTKIEYIERFCRPKTKRKGRRLKK